MTASGAKPAVQKGIGLFMNSGSDVLNLILLVIAVVVFIKLRSVLGRRTGHERPPFDPYSAQDPKADNEQGNVINLPGTRGPGNDQEAPHDAAPAKIPGVTTGSPLAQSLARLTQEDRHFEANEFLGGAKLAYEMIVTAFAGGDSATLQPLLGPEVFESFNGVIKAREERGDVVDMTFVGLRSAEFVEASLEERRARVTVRFVSELTSSTKNNEGVVIEGDPITVREITDVWTFERDIADRDPNWQLVATGGV